MGNITPSYLTKKKLSVKPTKKAPELQLHPIGPHRNLGRP